jgi:methyl-accepting chemotaxis protein
MIQLWNFCLVWFGNLRLKTKLLISFGWQCLFTAVLGIVALAGLNKVGDLAIAHATATDSVSASVQQTVSNTQWTVLALLVFIICLDIVMALRLTYIIAVPIIEASNILARLAQHDLTVQARVVSTDEVGQMNSALNSTIEHLRNVLLGLRTQAAQLNQAVVELETDTDLTTTNCKNQADIAAEVLDSAQLLTSMCGEIRHNSNEVTSASEQSAQSAHSGGEVMAGAAATMEEVAKSSESIHALMGQLDQRSQEISKAVTVIREISENTNLLALNASIEAARAGEHGRGFAVVAGEVRSLAEHTRTATEQIGSMVASIQQQTASTIAAVEANRSNIENGRRRTEDAHRMLEEIIARAQKTGSFALNTAAAAEEQSKRSEGISASAGRVTELAEASRSAANLAAQTARQIAESAGELGRIFNQFRL